MNTVKPESIALFCLTPGGVRLAKRLAAMLPLTCYTSEALQEEGFIPFNGGFASAAREAFSSFSALIFIGATGIAVRVLAPLVNDKLSDPAVVVIDERARHVISLLSGHAGGANALTRYLAGMLDADPVITTATDVNELAALDTLAFQLNARMTDFRAAVKTVNQMLVSGKRVGLWCDGEFTGALSRCDQRGFIPVSDLARLPALDALICVTLRRSLPPLPVPHWKLVPQRVVAGIGCRRDTPCALLSTVMPMIDCTTWIAIFLQQGLAHCGCFMIICVKNAVCSKPRICSNRMTPFETFSAEALREHEHRFPASSFVRETVGVGSVSGPVAWLLSQGNLSGETLREQGVTITLGVTH
ncbi:cobalt-precorrin 5A hydrolase [Klebsiella pneumoniae]